MKEITDNFLEENLAETGDEKSTLYYGDYKAKLSKKIWFEVERKKRYFEVNNIKDIERNYDALSKNSYLPLSYCLWDFINGIPVLFNLAESKNSESSNSETQSSGDPDLNELKEYFDLTWHNKTKFSFKRNLNYAFISNVYLGNFNFIKKKSFGACELDIRDNHNKTIRGVLAYRHHPIEPKDDSLEPQLAKVLSASESTPFDLEFQALSENYKIKQKGVYIPRGKKLLILDIHRRDGGSDENTDFPKAKFPRVRAPQLI